ncbi:MAG: CRTAC1 family protein [Pirellulaceae bacterium]|nr:CRTAC1 family protein [Planctomycetales bacterium]
MRPFTFPVLVAIVLKLFVLVTGSVLVAAPVLRDVTKTSGIDHVHNQSDPTLLGLMSGGAAAGDFDGDGWVDLYVTRIDAPGVLYRNNQDGTFVDVTSAVFADPHSGRRMNGAVWGDIDNDGDLDLYVTAWMGNSNYLYVNDEGTFRERGVERGAAVSPGTIRSAVSATFGDYDGDGFVDLYTTEWQVASGENHSRLLRNLGTAAPGYFEDVTIAAGVAIQGRSYTFAPRFTDLDQDGWVDLAIAADFTRSEVYWNNGDGTFRQGADQAGITGDRSAMGFALGDVDRDGDLDWFLGNADIDGNNLLINQLAEGTPRTFVERVESSGIQETGWTWGATFLDFDNDGWLDVAATNGYVLPGDDTYVTDPVYLFRGDGQRDTVRFSDVSDAVLLPRDNQFGSGIVVFDYDRDGDQDLFVVNGGAGQRSVLYRNDGGNEQAHLRVHAVGTISNRQALGAKITVVPDLENPSERWVWEVNAGSNFLGQNEATAHFGLGNRTDDVDLVQIRWPNGNVERRFHVPINSEVTLVQHVPEPCNILVCLVAFVLAQRARKRVTAPMAEN